METELLKQKKYLKHDISLVHNKLIFLKEDAYYEPVRAKTNNHNKTISLSDALIETFTRQSNVANINKKNILNLNLF